ncbi:MAG: ribokinase [Candidatus Glassbacteria bacterium]|nr:ribokinase [Candidatus Glassbacteria bacterium]
MSAKPVVVIGSSNMDLVIKTTRIPRPGETILGGEFVMVAGGKGANQAVAAARLGAHTWFVARVGEDPFGDKMLRNFADEGIETAHVTRDPEQASGVATITVDEDGENAIVVAPGANGQVGPEDVRRARETIESADSVLMQLEIPLDAVAEAAGLATAAGVRVILDPAPARELPDELLRNVSLLTPNETEAELLTGIGGDSLESARAQAEALLARGVKAVLITRGKQGSLLVDQSGGKSFPTEAVESVDSTAAGDCFNGALAARLASGAPLEEAIAFASKAAAISTTRLGAQDSLPRLGEVAANT